MSLAVGFLLTLAESFAFGVWAHVTNQMQNVCQNLHSHNGLSPLLTALSHNMSLAAEEIHHIQSDMSGIDRDLFAYTISLNMLIGKTKFDWYYVI